MTVIPNFWIGPGFLLVIISQVLLTIGENPVPGEGISESNEVLAFPGAEGFGKHTSGGRGGRVVVVTNLNDDGPGSLREAIRMKVPRIIVFEVSGTIALESPLDINYGNLTIAGQSAPGAGICLRNYPIKVKDDNVIIRYIRARLGDEHEVQDDGISIIGQKDIILDHCSFSWGTDEVATFYDNENFTLQWCIISESLNNSIHRKGEHGYGGIWGGMGASFHHNVLAHHKSRNPRLCGARYHKQPELEVVDFRNNIIYNWRSNSTYGGEEGNYNVVNNYYKPGPATSGAKRSRFLDPWSPYGRYYVSGNILYENPEVSQDNIKGIDEDFPLSRLADRPVAVVKIPGETARKAYRLVLAEAGANIVRDAVDQRIVEEVASGSARYGREGDGIIDSQNEVGGWPELSTSKPLADNDRDGMPDRWERSHGLDPDDPRDASIYTLGRDYTNVEIYLNELVETS